MQASIKKSQNSKSFQVRKKGEKHTINTVVDIRRRHGGFLKMVKGTNTEGEEDGIGERKELEKNGIIDKAKFFARERKGGISVGGEILGLWERKSRKGVGRENLMREMVMEERGKQKVWCWDWTAEVFGVINTVIGEEKEKEMESSNSISLGWKWECVDAKRHDPIKGI